MRSKRGLTPGDLGPSSAGNADKEQVQHMVRVLLSYEGKLTLDESDALALALCHAHSRAIGMLLQGADDGVSAQ